MFKYTCKRLLFILPTIVIITLMAFLIMSKSSGTPGSVALGITASQEDIDAYNHEIGYDRPVMVRYAEYMWNALHGDFGNSYKSAAPVIKILAPKFPTTLRLALLSVCVAALIGIPVGVLGKGMDGIIIALIVTSVPGFARIIRSIVLNVVHQKFIEAAVASGTSHWKIIVRHVLPNCFGPILVDALMSVSGCIMVASGLSFLGMGIQVPAPEWGAMLSDATQYMRSNPYLAIFPGIAIVLTSLCFNLVGDGLTDALDPKNR